MFDNGNHAGALSFIDESIDSRNAATSPFLSSQQIAQGLGGWNEQSLQDAWDLRLNLNSDQSQGNSELLKSRMMGDTINFPTQTSVSSQSISSKAELRRSDALTGQLDDLSWVGTLNKDSSFDSFIIADASGDDSETAVFEDGAIRFSYDWFESETLLKMNLIATQNNQVSLLGTWAKDSLSNKLVNLAKFDFLTAGDCNLQFVAETSQGIVISDAVSLEIQAWTKNRGNFAANTFNVASNTAMGGIFLGQGGTDTLRFNDIPQEEIVSINGIQLSDLDVDVNSTWNQAIFQGTAYDYITLANGQEIYFQGIEKLRFADGVVNLQVQTNDPYFGYQWNLHTSDVGSAWRFTKGSKDVLLVSLDTGVLTEAGAAGGIVDLDENRLLVDITDDDNGGGYGHGHCSISVMSATANNNEGVAGINWYSDILVHDLYGENGASRISLQAAIAQTIDYARENDLKVVFQGGIQGEFWLNDGGTQAELEQLIAANADVALFAIAAGNGGIDIDDRDSDRRLSGGVARLQSNYENVIAVGALENRQSNDQWADNWVDGLMNATTVRKAPYSNFGSSLTLMAATDSPAMDKLGGMRYFNGTSCANPNMAGIASLVWSVNPELSGKQIRQILIDTAMDLGVEGRDQTFGHGLVNADAAVRRAWALAQDARLAALY